MKAVIMAGGFGTRLRPITCNIPKPMVPVANIPMMEHIVNLLKKFGMTKILSILYFQPEVITRYFGNGSDFGVEMDYVMATADYGTAGSVKNSEAKLKDSPFIIISGDVLTDFDLDAAIRFHQERKAMATMVLTRVANPLEYGVVITAEDGRIIRFLEKPSWGEVFSDTINTGIYILQPEVLAQIPPQTEFDFSKNLFPLMLKEKMPLYGYIAEGYWKDIGDINEYRLAHRNLLDGNVQIQIPGTRLNVIGRDVWVGTDSKVGPKVKFKGGVIIGANCEIENGVELENSVLGDGCVVKAGARIVDSILWERVHVGAKAQLEGTIVSWDTQIKDGAVLEKGTVISEECRIGERAIVRSNVMIWPRKVVEDGSTVFTSMVWSDKWTKNLFTDLGISGLGNIEITPEFASKLGAAFGSSLPKGSSINTSRDGNKFSRVINRALICGLTSTGVNVADLRVTPGPLARFKPNAFHRAGGVHVKLSATDPNQVEIKIFDAEGRDLAPSQKKSIERTFNREDFRRVSLQEIGEITFPPRVPEYYSEELLRHVDVEAIKARGLKVVVDFAFTGASSIFFSFLGKLNCEVISLNAYQDETRLHRVHANLKSSLEKLAGMVRSLKADAGLMFDDGAERLYVVDDQGRVILGEEALVAWIKLVLTLHQNCRVAVPISATHLVDRLAEKAGATVIRTKTGHRALMNAAVNDKVIFAADDCGGLIFPEFQPTFDGIMGAVKLLEYLSRCGKPLSKLVGELPPFYCGSKRIPCPWESKGKVMRHAMEFARDKKTVLVDGVKVILSDEEWVLILPDPDQPFVNVTVEAGSEKRLEALLRETVEKVESWKDSAD
ncbi:MAG: Mannose-1-phosphate guanylyltransferase [Candidatus Ozemobacter sibiricus]|uniref:Mannose-1-phosphate guanylyltransferase n=1 Tax=Candidatus Ozemobacter sibiricus TaxID=2268124 RepID=A0A367ZRW8_9BACT|nr:MAG: Mannose-1-phosphate guanylyltransferase [Candidatus Ozemobacter sibiricus]